MERAETDVATKVANHTWTIDQTLRAFHDICRAVQRIHLRQLVHRDLKPSNFLVMPSGKIKLSDFGTARFLDGSEPPLLINYDRIPGDMRYAAPEIFAGLHDVDPRYAFKADVFSLGTILFEMLTGVNLGVHVFGPPLLTAFANHMMVVPRADRPSVYEQIVANISAANPLPSITAFAPLIPASIRSIVDQLYRGMCNFDYRARNCDFNSIFRHIDACVLILNNEVKYRRWQEEKRKRRLARLAKGKGVTT
jgi:serine/threonine protein kinase